MELSLQAIELARRHGWTEEPVTTPAYFGARRLVAQPGPAESRQSRGWTALSVPFGLRSTPAKGIMAHYTRGALELACGREHEALAAFRGAERLAGLLVTPHPLARRARAFSLRAFLRLGETEVVESALAGLDEQRPRETVEMRMSPRGAATRSGSPAGRGGIRWHAVVEAARSRMGTPVPRLVQAFFLDAIARDALGDPQAAARALERALEIAEPDSVLFPFLLHRGTRTARPASPYPYRSRRYDRPDPRPARPGRA